MISIVRVVYASQVDTLDPTCKFKSLAKRCGLIQHRGDSTSTPTHGHHEPTAFGAIIILMYVPSTLGHELNCDKRVT